MARAGSCATTPASGSCGSTCPRIAAPSTPPPTRRPPAGSTALSEGRQTDARRPPELSTRDNVARAIYTEVREGRGSPHGGVFLDISYLPAETVRRKLPSMYEQFKELADVDITKGPMEVGPTTHYVMGGIRVDAETGATTVPGLFAAGEVAGGMHGANRLGGNSLSDLLVFGARTGRAAAELRRRGRGAVRRPGARSAARRPELAAPLERTERRGSVRHPARPAGDDAAAGRHLPGRGGPDEALGQLADAAPSLAAVRATGGRAYNPGWNLVFELGNLLTVSEAITRSALQRTESRGAHSRLDYPVTDEATWGGVNSVVCRAADGHDAGRRRRHSRP